ncbi:MAG: DegQ family serine endoprotease [Acidiferrobacterales bacterium]|nr:DegQ family serine endoprotease [Acidiferrobacterales bacterium]
MSIVKAPRRGVKFQAMIATLLAITFLTGTAVSTRSQAALPASPPNFVEVVKKTMPAVVNISTTRVVQSEGGSPFPFFGDPFNQPFGGDPFGQEPKKHREGSLGSGVIVDSAGYIVTNNHVVEKADEIKVVLNDKREFEGKIIGTDPKTDIAVIKISGKDLPVLPWGDSDKLEVGGYVLAIGSPLGLNQTVTMGIVSAKGRANVGIADYEDFIQTDAAINPGNSGGALVNTDGEVVGINTAIFSRSGGNMGIGFAVPSNMARSVMAELIKHGKVTRGWFGVSIQEVTPALAKQFGLKDATGALVSETIEDTPAAKAGIKPGDVILEFDGKKVADASALRNIVAATPIGKSVRVKVVRDKSSKVLTAKIVEQPKRIAGLHDEDSQTGKGTALAGIRTRDLSPEIASQLGLEPNTAGVLVTNVEVGTPAEKAGLAPGDVILAITRKQVRTPVRSVEEFQKLASALRSDEAVLLWIVRRGNRRFIPVEP